LGRIGSELLKECESAFFCVNFFCHFVKGKKRSLTTGTNKGFFIFFERNELQLLDFEKKQISRLLP
jgi:hypothetical protein